MFKLCWQTFTGAGNFLFASFQCCSMRYFLASSFTVVSSPAKSLWAPGAQGNAKLSQVWGHVSKIFTKEWSCAIKIWLSAVLAWRLMWKERSCPGEDFNVFTGWSVWACKSLCFWRADKYTWDVIYMQVSLHQRCLQWYFLFIFQDLLLWAVSRWGVEMSTALNVFNPPDGAASLRLDIQVDLM